MQVFSGISKIKKSSRPVVALGVFDGLHRGHRVILDSAVKKALVIKGTSVAVTFWPHPQKEESLYSLEHRLRLFCQLGIDVCIVIRFSKAFARVSAEDFIRNVLVKRIAARFVFVGEDFRFGRDTQGDLRLLKQAGQKYNFAVEGLKIIKVKGRPISSNRIRRLIKGGQLAKAQVLLGRPVSAYGTVIKGFSVSAKLGYPTANINVHHEVLPPQGVYAVRVLFENKLFNAACYIGEPPSFPILNTRHQAPCTKHRVEVHILNFHKNIYGKQIEVQFIKRLRDKKKFSSTQSLALQIKKDIAVSRKFLSLL